MATKLYVVDKLPNPFRGAIYSKNKAHFYSAIAIQIPYPNLSKVKIFYECENDTLTVKRMNI
ncbi:CLUMA_CG008625, isoform A [Clunio marinus]|uniref:CLUMA_CG008625, isoform A n=1 Tax=Clunio marinus TaxID=568069 RepID=A0A1J1I6E6_9DIPT|nr:CLUMA_CG008625, isoform A [Clunio marinus]